MAEKPTYYKFTGSAQDYMDWFRGIRDIKMILPDSQTDGEGLPPLEDEEDQLPPLPPYLNPNYDHDYTQQYKDQLVQEYEESQCDDVGSSTTTRHHSLNALEEDTTTGTIADNHLGSEALKTQVYVHYDFSTRTENTYLPVFDAQKEVLEKINAYQVVVIEGETGCGKSTQVPQFILDQAVQEHRHCNIIVTQPRRIAAISLAQRVCQERGWPLGKLVGYQVGLDRCIDQDTRLAFVTTEVLVQKLIHRRSLDDYTHVILDEVHERDQHTDFALLIVKKLIHTVSRHVKVILMSATIDASKFAQYFATPLREHFAPAPIISVGETYVHSVQIFYLDSLSVICKGKDEQSPVQELPNIDPDDPGIPESMFRLVSEMVKRFDNMERQEEGIKSASRFARKRGAILAFLPGLKEIETLMETLRKDASPYQWHLYPLHSTITKEEQQSVFCDPVPGFRKIIISTNIAESSITVPDIKYVIDFCLTKVLMCDKVTNYTSLKMAWASQASCRQRAGRCGRVSPGRVYRLVPQNFYETLPSYSTPELCRTPLSHVVLKTKVLDMGEPRALLALAMDPPNLSDIHRTILVLKQMGALAVTSKGQMTSLDGDLTYLGRVVAHLPLDPHLSKLIVMGYLFGCLRETIIIAAGLSLKNFHSRPFQDELNAFLSKVSWSYGSFSDCMAILNTYDLWQSSNAMGEYLRPSGKKEREWATRSYVQLNNLRDVHLLVVELTERLQKLKVTVRNRQNPPRYKQNLILKMCMASAFYPYYYKRSLPEDYEEEMCRELNGHDPFTTVILSGLPTATNILYDDQIRKLFRECSQNLSISYEGSKAYMTFPRSGGSIIREEHFQDIPGACPTSMHLALKMRQVVRIQQGLVLHLYSQDEAHIRMAKTLAGERDSASGFLESSSSLSQRTLGSKRLRTSRPSNSILKPPVLPAPTNHTWRVFITHVESAGHFWVISKESSAISDLNFIMSSIDLAMRGGQTKVLELEMVFPGQICLAEYTDYEGYTGYYRARIEEVYNNNNSIRVLVFFVDYGNTEVLPAVALRTLPESVMDLNMLAVECMLAKVKPPFKSATGTWEAEATNWLRSFALNKDFTVQIYSVVHNIIRVTLLDMDGNNMTSINNTLISKGYADKAKEFYLSKQNHKLRAIYSSTVDNVSLESSCSIAPAFSSLSLKFSDDSGCNAGKVRLRGPESPLLLRFVALTRTGCTKSVRIDTTSVNSTALDLEPQNPHDRFIIGSFVSLNSSEMIVTVRNTTLMPSIPGLMSLCLLLFSPCAELRVNMEGTRYTGALVGLGSDLNTGHAIYPDDDIELEFDINFTQEDLMKVNKIRFQMNAVLEEGEEVTDAMLISTQKRLRELTLELLDEPRTYQAPKGFHRAYRWQMMNPEEILHPVMEDALSDTSVQVFPLHCGIFLKPDHSATQVLDNLKNLKDLELRLTSEHCLPSELVKMKCSLCDELIITLMDLRLHLMSSTHRYRELKLKK